MSFEVRFVGRSNFSMPQLKTRAQNQVTKTTPAPYYQIESKQLLQSLAFAGRCSSFSVKTETVSEELCYRNSCKTSFHSWRSTWGIMAIGSVLFLLLVAVSASQAQKKCCFPKQYEIYDGKCDCNVNKPISDLFVCLSNLVWPQQ